MTLSKETAMTLATLRGILRRLLPSTGRSNRMEAVILADFVAESVATLAAEAIGLTVPRDTPFPKVLGDLAKGLRDRGETLQYESRMRTLHDVRNLVQHRAEIPAPAVAERARADVEDFAEELVSTVWSVSFNALSGTDQVEDKELRRSLEEGAVALRNGDRKNAVIAVAFAADRFHTLLGESPRWFHGAWKSEFERAFGRSDASPWRFDQVALNLQDMVNRLEILEAGLSGADYQWFRERVPRVMWTPNGLGRIFFPRDSLNLSDLGRAYELLVDWILTTRLDLEVPRPPQAQADAVESIDIPPGWPDSAKPDSV